MPHRKHQNHPPGKDQFHGVIESLHKFFVGRRIEYRYAAEGEKRYSSKKDKDESGIFERGCNGTSIWIRQVANAENRPYATFTVSPENLRLPDGRRPFMRFIYPESWLALVVGAAMSGPNLAAQRPWDDDLFYYDQTDLQQWKLTASNALETVDGVRCAVVSGTVEMSFKSKPGKDEKRIRHVKGWFDIEHGMALKQWEENPSGVRVINSHFEEAKPGLWLPQEVEVQSIAAADAEKLPEQYRGKLLLSTKIKVNKCTVNETPDSFFAPRSHLQPGDAIMKVDEKDRASPVNSL